MCVCDSSCLFICYTLPPRRQVPNVANSDASTKTAQASLGSRCIATAGSNTIVRKSIQFFRHTSLHDTKVAFTYSVAYIIVAVESYANTVVFTPLSGDSGLTEDKSVLHNMLAANITETPRPRPPAKARRSASLKAASTPPPAYAAAFDLSPGKKSPPDASLLGSPLLATFRRVGWDNSNQLPPTSEEDREWMNEKSREELSELLLKAEDLIRDRENGNLVIGYRHSPALTSALLSLGRPWNGFCSVQDPV